MQIMFHMMDTKYDENELQRALLFLSRNFMQSGNNPKPVVLHSIRVAEMLWSQGAEQDTVMAAILHDVIEDTDISFRDVEREFGTNVAELVRSLTHEKHGDFAERLEFSLDSYRRSRDLSIESLKIRACDLIDNSYYYHEADTEDKKRYLYAKYSGFMEIAAPYLDGSSLWAQLTDAFQKNVHSLASLAEANHKV